MHSQPSAHAYLNTIGPGSSNTVIEHEFRPTSVEKPRKLGLAMFDGLAPRIAAV
jgi:hypothetical protein